MVKLDNRFSTGEQTIVKFLLMIINIQFFPSDSPEVGIYKRKEESKKTRKYTFDQESDQENKKKKENTLD